VSNDERAFRAQVRLDQLTKPIGSLGLMEPVLVRMAEAQQRVIARLERPVLLIFAADHGVAQEGVSRYQPTVTEEMAVNIAMGAAVSSVLARQQQIPVHVIDVGVARTVRHPAVVAAKVRPGTDNLLRGPAMSRTEAQAAVQTGREMVRRLRDQHHDVVLLGELGIGNTTAASALAAYLLGVAVERVVGVGTGVSPDVVARKQAVVQEALAHHQPAIRDLWDAMACFGGLEIAALAGAMMEAHEAGMMVLLDGFVTAVAALWAVRVSPSLKPYLLASHQSAEPGHAVVLEALGLTPLLHWQMRLGEGSGALMAYPLIHLATHVMAETATFEDAQVTPEGHPSAPAVTTGLGDTPPVAIDFSPAERQAVYKVMRRRRDVRVFLPDPVPPDTLQRILEAAHWGPSVGLMQPWNFIVIQNRETLNQIHAMVNRERLRAADNYRGLRQAHYLRLKVEGLLQAPVAVCVTRDPHRGGPHVLGRNTIPETDLMSVACAIENLWLAARAEGIGVGWVSIYVKDEMRDILKIPPEIDPVALLSLGYTPYFAEEPGLQRAGWARRLPLAEVVFAETWGQPAPIRGDV
jgi:nicotinate-nucleotide--dimethylbenzimidazole phosphoribosyltransferase